LRGGLLCCLLLAFFIHKKGPVFGHTDWATCRRECVLLSALAEYVDDVRYEVYKRYDTYAH
jgi:hypothetical protein